MCRSRDGVWCPNGRNTRQVPDFRRYLCGTRPMFMFTHSGPPGTGKTTTISAASQIWDFQGKGAWIVAHSNVAVKNIAEALAKKEVNFKLIVSKEFHHEWYFTHICTVLN